MKNKRGFANPYLVAGIALVVIIGISAGWFNSNKNCDAKLGQEKNISSQLRNQLSGAQSDLDNANQIIVDKNRQIGNLTNQLSNCDKPDEITHYETFNLFGIGNIIITKGWNIVINIAFGFSLISIPLWKFYLFGRRKKNKK